MPYEFMSRDDMEKMVQMMQSGLDSTPMDSVESCSECLECSNTHVGSCEHRENDRPPSLSV